MKKIVLAFALLIGGQIGFAQVSGPSPVTVGSTQTYSYTTSTNYSDWYWEAVGGEVTSQSKTGSVYSATVHWTDVSSSNTITLWRYAVIQSQPTYIGAASKTVEVQPDVPATPNVTATTTQYCDYTTVSYTQ